MATYEELEDKMNEIENTLRVIQFDGFSLEVESELKSQIEDFVNNLNSSSEDLQSAYEEKKAMYLNFASENGITITLKAPQQQPPPEKKEQQDDDFKIRQNTIISEITEILKKDEIHPDDLEPNFIQKLKNCNSYSEMANYINYCVDNSSTFTSDTSKTDIKNILLQALSPYLSEDISDMEANLNAMIKQNELLDAKINSLKQQSIATQSVVPQQIREITPKKILDQDIIDVTKGKILSPDQIINTKKRLELKAQYRKGELNQGQVFAKGERGYAVMRANGQDYVIYRGKNEKREDLTLGQGAFGRVKFAQNLDDATWDVVKIQLVTRGNSLNNIRHENDLLVTVGLGKGSIERPKILKGGDWVTTVHDLINNDKWTEAQDIVETEAASGNRLAKFLEPQMRKDHYKNDVKKLITDAVNNHGNAEVIEVVSVLKYIPGKSLRKAIEPGEFPKVTASQLSQSIIAAYQSQVQINHIIHRDLKPDNIMVDDQGNVRIIDFGLADYIHNIRPGGGGSPLYMSPERRSDSPIAADEQTEVYSLGMTLQEVLGFKKLHSDGEWLDSNDCIQRIPDPQQREILKTLCIHMTSYYRPRPSIQDCLDQLNQPNINIIESRMLVKRIDAEFIRVAELLKENKCITNSELANIIYDLGEPELASDDHRKLTDQFNDIKQQIQQHNKHYFDTKLNGFKQLAATGSNIENNELQNLKKELNNAMLNEDDRKQLIAKLLDVTVSNFSNLEQNCMKKLHEISQQAKEGKYISVEGLASLKKEIEAAMMGNDALAMFKEIQKGVFIKDIRGLLSNDYSFYFDDNFYDELSKCESYGQLQNLILTTIDSNMPYISDPSRTAKEVLTEQLHKRFQAFEIEIPTLTVNEPIKNPEPEEQKMTTSELSALLNDLENLSKRHSSMRSTPHEKTQAKLEFAVRSLEAIKQINNDKSISADVKKVSLDKIKSMLPTQMQEIQLKIEQRKSENASPENTSTPGKTKSAPTTSHSEISAPSVNVRRSQS